MPHATHACVISRTPHASPPQKMARNALEDVEAVDTAEAEGIEKAPSIIKLATGPEFRRFDPGIVLVLISIRNDQPDRQAWDWRRSIFVGPELRYPSRAIRNLHRTWQPERHDARWGSVCCDQILPPA